MGASRAGSRLVVPAFAEPHAHLDRAFSLEVTGPNSTGTLEEGILRFRGALRRMNVETLRPGAVRALRMLQASGVAHVRTHTAVGGALGFRAWEAVEAAAAEVPEVEVRQVPMPVDPNCDRPEVARWIREAAARGAVAVGGAPWLAEDRAKATQAAASLAAELGIGLDLHVDEVDRPEVNTLAVLASTVEAMGLGGRAVAAHCCSLAMRSDAVARAETKMLASAGVAVVVCPVSNLALQGRASGSRGLAPLRVLKAAGVTVGIGVDNIRDVVLAAGTADPLRAAWLAALAGHLCDEEGLEWLGRCLVSGNRAVCGLPEGEPALVLEAASLAEAVALVPARSRIESVRP
jgi:cytosine deaminase